MTGRIQLFLQSGALGEAYEAFKGWDVGDIVGAEGTLMRTKTGELVGALWNRSAPADQDRCVRCRTSGTGWPMSSSAIASVTST